VKDARQIAAELGDFFGTACQDIAYQRPWDYMDDAAQKWAITARANGCRDLPGAYADHLYNDPDLASDLLGDRLYDACGDDDELHDACVDALQRDMDWMPGSLFESLRRKPIDTQGVIG